VTLIWNVDINNSKVIVNRVIRNLCYISIRNHILLTRPAHNLRGPYTNLFHLSFNRRSNNIISNRKLVLKNDKETGNDVTYQVLSTKTNCQSQNTSSSQ